MDQKHSHSCPNCEYQNGNPGKPAIKGDLIECLVCGTSWKEYSGAALARDPDRKHADAVSMLRKMARNEGTLPAFEATVHASERPQKVSGLFGAVLFGALMIGGTAITTFVLDHGSRQIENSEEQISISGVKIREQIGRDGRKVITVRGSINNQTPHHHAVPKIAIILKRKDGGEIVRWHYNPPARSIVPGGKTQFASSIQYDTPIIAYAEAIIE